MMSEAEPPDVIGWDHTSFEDFVAGSSARLFTMARLLTGGHRAEAEDLLQGAFEPWTRRQPLRTWKAHSVHAGPVWFIYARPVGTPPSGQRLAVGKLTASAMAIAISNGTAAVVRTAPAAGGRFRFLASFNSTGKPYTLAEGAPGLTRAGCPAEPAATNIPESYAPGLTMFWEGNVTDLRGCVPVQVSTSPASQPIRVTLAATSARCRS
jgi:hypothetical protein